MTKARVNIETARRRYRPGEIISEQLSEADLAHFRERNFIIEEDDVGDVASEDGWLGGIPGIGRAGDGLDTVEPGYKDEAALDRMTKAEIVEYAAGIGLELNGSSVKPDLVSAVLDYVGEKSEEQE